MEDKFNLFKLIELMIDRKIEESDRELDKDISYSLEIYRKRLVDVESKTLNNSFKISDAKYISLQNQKKLKNLDKYEIEVAAMKEILRETIPVYKKYDPKTKE